ncbi:A-kinase anchor SPHKAP isoform X1 [Pelobates cultripes]|uniref:A-kinase anchor SPHKAP isoform X1 n=1 Tax=Pelobates cultripes TaxID=61616 RepID=A0AAD1VQS8_PELCU|nr:A-kinase anchor SPHKAP isoform X1 [Pelobates cultripes]
MWPHLSHSNLELAVMYGGSDNHGGSGGSSIVDTPTSNLGSSITACKKVLCTNRPSESLEYWLQNSRNLCRIGLVEDGTETNCTSICFVNLNITDEESSHATLQKKLVDVSPELPKLMKSVRAQKLKENEIVLLSGLTSGRLRPTIENQQASWQTDVCLLQFGKDLKKSYTGGIILELNKFLLGLELTQENLLQPDTSPFRADDDTNCSVSSIEEDFLTASEQLEEDSETENKRELPESPGEKIIQKTDESLQNKKCRVGHHRKSSHIQRSLEVTDSNAFVVEAQMETSEKLRLAAEKDWQRTEWTSDYQGRRPSLQSGSREEIMNCGNGRSKSVPELFNSRVLDEKTQFLKNQQSKVCTAGNFTDSFDDPATTGQYATNLAECVLQDAFIRLSQTDTSFAKEAAVSISANNYMLSGVIPKKGSPVTSHPWNELPKIVIVQSPDSCDNPTEWVDESHWQEQENLKTDLEYWSSEDGSSGFTQSTLEMALACAASVIGTISSPHTADKFKVEHDVHINTDEKNGSEQDTAGFPSIVPVEEYSVPSALCGMTQVASAVAVCGLGDQKQAVYPATSSVLLAAADTSAAVTLHCSLALGSSMENFKDCIAKVLLKEAAVVLTSPNTYKNVGEFIESMKERLLSSVSSSKLTHVDDVINHDLAHNLSDTILRHSAEEASKRLQGTDSHICAKSQSAFVTSTTELLFNVMHFTCKKMSDLLQSRDLPFDLEDKSKGANSKNEEMHLHDLVDSSLVHTTLGQWHQRQLNEVKNELNSNKLPQSDENDVKAPPTEQVCNNSQLEVHVKTPCSKQYLKRESYRLHHNEHRVARESILTADECKYSTSTTVQGWMEGFNNGSQEKPSFEGSASKDFPSNLNALSNYMLHPSQAAITLKQSAKNYCLTDFADDLAETVVSMATEMAAICLENSNGKQPWFCAWAKGSECLMTSCRTIKRKKDGSSGGAVVRRHRPPRLSEIKKKTDEHPELKERLMNRVVDESINLEDTSDPVSAFANEVASKILTLKESSVGDLWQGQNVSRNRLYCERLNRGKASSYESIPEEDMDAKSLLNTLGPGSFLGQPSSRTSSVSKQSSCESITDEFSRFMVNQMENEGREFELLLDYYAGKNANNILNSAMQQISRRNSHLNVKSTCLSKQSSTESITEEFYRYMLKEIDKESRDVKNRNTAEWTSSLMPPPSRTPFCFRQSSMPCNRSSSARLTVNTPVKANSLDGFARSGSQDFLHLQPANSISSTNLCKSDSCLYQRGQTDQATDMLIHETWSSSIEALMRKNKIIADSVDDEEAEPSPNGSPAHVDSYANKLAADIVQSGKSIIVLQDSFESTSNGNSSCKSLPLSPCKHADRSSFETNTLIPNKSRPVYQPGLSTGSREVPVIQIETDQREESEEEGKGNKRDNLLSKDSLKQGVERCISSSAGVRAHHGKNTPVLPEKTRSEALTLLSSSEDSTGSWSQLATEEEILEDTSSFLQLSERSASNGNSSTASSAGGMELELFLEVPSPSHTVELKLEEKHPTKETQENPDDCTSGLSVGTVSCQFEVCILNIDLESDCADSELRSTLQWIAASELGIPAIYFKKSQEHMVQKFLQVMHLVQAKSWKVGDIFSALMLHCKMQEQGSKVPPSFFDWLLEKG